MNTILHTMLGSVFASIAAFSFIVAEAYAEPLQANYVSDYHGRFTIVETAKDTPVSREFLRTGKNAYTADYLKNPDKAKEGKKIFQLYSCLACHGGNGQGMTGPDLTDAKINNSKIQTDKGMFEVIAAGTNDGMSPRHAQVAKDPNLMSTDEILKIIGWIRSQYRGPKEDAKTWN